MKFKNVLMRLSNFNGSANIVLCFHDEQNIVNHSAEMLQHHHFTHRSNRIAHQKGLHKILFMFLIKQNE